MRKTWRRLATVAAGVAAISLLATGCSGDSSTSADGKTTITVYGWKGNADAPADVPTINKAFEKANPDITVNYKFYNAGSAIAQKLQPEFLAGSAPDVLMTDPTTMRQYQKSGYLADLSGEKWASTVADPVKPFVSVKSKVYGAPLELIGIGLYANMAILKEAGITEYPTTNAEFVKDLETLKAKNLPGLSVPNKGGYSAEAIINGIASTLVYSKNPSWDKDFVAGKTSFSDWKSSIEQFERLGSSGLVDFKSDLGVDEWGQAPQDFQAGKTAFLYQGAWDLATFLKAQPDTQFGPWPAADSGSQSATIFSGVNWSVNAASKNMTAAKKYVAFWTQTENLDGFLEAEAAFTPYTGGTSPTSDASALESKAFEAGDYRILGADSWFTGANETAMGQDVQSLMLGKATPSSLVTKWDKSFKTAG